MERQAKYEEAMIGVRGIGEDAYWSGSGEIVVQISEAVK